MWQKDTVVALKSTVFTFFTAPFYTKPARTEGADIRERAPGRGKQ